VFGCQRYISAVCVEIRRVCAMNLKKIEFKDADLEYIKDNGAAKFVKKVFDEVKITDEAKKKEEKSEK